VSKKKKLKSKEELQQIIADAEAELIELEEPVIEDLTQEIESTSDYTYWEGNSKIIIDILNGEFHPINSINKNLSRMYEIELSHAEMESSKEMNLRIVRYWKQEPVVERGEVTHFRRVDIVEKRYNWNWELIDG